MGRDRVVGKAACVLSVKCFHKTKSMMNTNKVCSLRGSAWAYCFGRKNKSLCETWPFKYLPAEMLSDFTALHVNCKENYRTNAGVFSTLLGQHTLPNAGFTWCLPCHFSLPFDNGRLVQLFKATRGYLHVTQSSQPCAMCCAGDLGCHELFWVKGDAVF